jgi:ParB-like chromosome segregation protein Spo0J
MTLKWVKPSTLHGNSYNPNRVFSLELELLKKSIIENGWTQPIVVRHDNEIVDGFHRWTVAKDPEVAALTGGLVPVVVLPVGTLAEQMMATVRHNRARGQHGILKMADIVRAAQAEGLSEEAICSGFGMEPEELDRLADMRPSPKHAGKDSFGRGWVPDPNS